MSVAVETLLTPTQSQVVNVNGTEIPGTQTLETDEELMEEGGKAETPRLNDIPRAGAKKTYSKDELLALKDSPVTKIRPSGLSDKYCNRNGVWEPELWYYSEESEKRSASPIDSKCKLLVDGIVLSPQGRSFARGCQVTGKQERDGRNKLGGQGWEPRERSGSQRGRISPSVDSKFERNTRSEKYNASGRNRRGRTGSLESQPEWFTHGPSSQLDTIELRGFDEGEKENKRKKRKKDDGNSNQRRLSADDMFDDKKKFDINEFFDMAENALPISGLFENQITSRFSQWFNDGKRSRSGSFNASHSNSQSNSRRSSIADELAEIAGLTLNSPARTPTPDSEFLFTPIAPASESSREDTTLNVLQDSEVDVQPLLDSVIPHKTVKGAVNLEDLEGEKKKDEAVKSEEKETEERSEMEESSEAFMKLVETMKASGNLPEKPTPTIPDIPPHLLPRPPSSKEKSRTASPSFHRSRSPSPLQLLQEVIRRAQSPVGLVGNAQVPATDPRVISPFEALRSTSPVVDMLSPSSLTRPLTPEELYGAPPLFNINTQPDPDLFEFTGSGSKLGPQPGVAKRKLNLARYNTSRTQANFGDSSSVAPAVNLSGPKFTNASQPAISQAFVPTSVLRKIHSLKHDQKSTDVHEKEKEKDPVLNSNDVLNKTTSHQDPVTPQRQPLFDVPNPLAASTTTLTSDSAQSSDSATSDRKNLMSPSDFSSPKRTVESGSEPVGRPELLTPHRLPLPGSPSSMTPHSLPLPLSPLVQDTPNKSTTASAMSAKQQLLTPRTLPLPQSPLVDGPMASSTLNGPSHFGIRPLAKVAAGNDDGQRTKARAPGSQDAFKRPLNHSTRPNTSGNNLRRFPQGQVPFRGQVPVTPGMLRRPVQPGIVPSPYNINATNLGRPMNVHPTALALALRNQQYQMARAAAVAAATAAVNRPPIVTPAQAAAAALLLNQQRASASAALHGLIPPISPHVFQQQPLRPNLPPALQHQHHVVHRSESSKENSLSKWFSDAVLSQSQSQPAAPSGGAKVLSVEELERHA